MKKIFSALVFAAVICSSAFAGGIDDPESSSGVAVIRNGTTFRLYYKGSESSNVKISILNDKKETLFTETLYNVNGFVRPYNFTNLNEGQYTIQIADRNHRHSETVQVVKSKTEKLARIAKVAGEEGRYLLTLSNKKANDITVRIYDGSNNMIYNEVEAVSTDFAKIYNLKNYTGKFTFEITDSSGDTKSLSY